MKKIPINLFHHGKCKICFNKHVFGLHVGYNTQIKGKHFFICENCLAKLVEVLFLHEPKLTSKDFIPLLWGNKNDSKQN